MYNARQQLPDEQTITFTSDVYTEMSMLAALPSTITQKKEALLCLLRALVRAEQYLAANEQESIHLVIYRLQNQPEDVVRGVWNSFRAELKLDNVLLAVLKREAWWFKENDIIKGEMPDFSDVLFPDYLEAVAPELVTIVSAQKHRRGEYE